MFFVVLATILSLRVYLLSTYINKNTVRINLYSKQKLNTDGACIFYLTKILFCFFFFLKPGGIHQIAVGNLLIQLLALLDGDFLDELGGDACPECARLNDRITQYQGSGGYDGPFAYHGIVQNSGTHTDEGAILDGCSVDGDVMPH